jgi:uncharacterized protein
LTRDLLKKGHSVHILSRKRQHIKSEVRYFYWNLKSSELDHKAFENVDVIINLADANIGAGRWSISRKREIIKCRVGAIKLLRTSIEEVELRPKFYMSASATGFYSDLKTDKTFKEDDIFGNLFLLIVRKRWEAEGLKKGNGF